MIKFETNQCPLCGQVLTLRKVHGVTVFQCPTGSTLHTTHYEVEIDSKCCVQHMYVGEWGIDNFANTNKTRIYRQVINGTGSAKWMLMKEVHQVRADIEERLLEKIQQLMQ